MALKDHSLDQKIIDAARIEFLLHGFQKASLHQIASRAGTTTGALYTRYESKDALFCSLVEAPFREAGEKLEPLHRSYAPGRCSRDPALMLQAIRAEEQIYHDLLTNHFDACVLFFSRSDGSSIQTKTEQIMAAKVRQTIAVLRTIAGPAWNCDGVELILWEQFRCYRLVLDQGYTPERSLACIQSFERFLEAGWKDLFEQIL